VSTIPDGSECEILPAVGGGKGRLTSGTRRMGADTSVLAITVKAASRPDEGIPGKSRDSRYRANRCSEDETTRHEKGSRKERNEHPGRADVSDRISRTAVMALHDRVKGGKGADDDDK
jgi:hypothetical protein